MSSCRDYRDNLLRISGVREAIEGSLIPPQRVSGGLRASAVQRRAPRCGLQALPAKSSSLKRNSPPPLVQAAAMLGVQTRRLVLNPAESTVKASLSAWPGAPAPRRGWTLCTPAPEAGAMEKEATVLHQRGYQCGDFQEFFWQLDGERAARAGGRQEGYA